MSEGIEEVCAELCETCLCTGEYSKNMESEAQEARAKCSVRKHFPQYAKCKVQENAT